MGEQNIVGELEDTVLLGICVAKAAETELTLLMQDIEKTPYLSKAVINQRLFEIKQSLDISHLVAQLQILKIRVSGTSWTR